MTNLTQQTLNGIDLEQFTETVDHIQNQPDLADFRFRASTEWLGGARARTRIREFHGAGEDHERERAFAIEGDEPPVLLGSDQAPNAVETVLHALTSCLTVGFVYNAAARGIEVRSLEMDVEGELDLHGFLGLSDETRAGYQGVTVTYRVDCSASDDEVDDLCAHVQRTSPVLDIMQNPVPVEVRRA